MAAEKRAFQAVADVNDVTVTRADGSAIVLTPGEVYETSDPGEIAMLEAAAGVKSASTKSPERSKA